MAAATVVLLVVLWLALTWFLWLQPLGDAVRRPPVVYDCVGRGRPGTVVLILLTGWIGGLYYRLRIRPDLVRAARELGSPATPAPNAQRESAGSISHGPSGVRSTESQSTVETGGAAPFSAAGHRREPDRELFVRTIPADVVSAGTIPPSSSCPPLPCSRQDVADAVLAIEPAADLSRPPRIYVSTTGLDVAITFPLEDPLSQVMIRVDGTSERIAADRFIAELLDRLGVRAFDTGSPGLIFATPVTGRGESV